MRVATLCLVIGVLGCGGRPAEPVDGIVDAPRLTPVPTSPSPVSPGAGPYVDGTVTFVRIEGGCWAIKVGNTLNEPRDLPNAFKQEGLAVRVILQPLENAGSYCMIGPIVSVVSIYRR